MKCLVCYHEIESLDSQQHYHPTCAKNLFGSEMMPEVCFGKEDVMALAKNIVSTHVSVPGVQKKLSADIIRIAGERHKVTLVGLWGDYILKPPTACIHIYLRWRTAPCSCPRSLVCRQYLTA